jgi:3-oxoadipate enol-lactonase
MDRLFANGTVNAAQSGNGPALFLFHSLLSDRASFDAIVPSLSRSFRVIVPELPGFGGSSAVTEGLAAVADRMAEVVSEARGGGDAVVLGNGYGEFVALQMAIRHPGIATRLVLADCGAAFSEAGREAFRNMAAVSKARGLQAITDVAMRRLFAPAFQAQHPELMRARATRF